MSNNYSKNNKCLDCNNLITNQSIRCKPCADEEKKGKHYSPETEIKKGQHISPETEFKKGKVSGNNNPFYGKKHTDELKKRWSKLRKGIRKSPETEIKKGEHKSPLTEFKKGTIPWNKGYGDYIKGELNPRFNGWSSREPYGVSFSPQFKEAIRKRDDYICILCNTPQEELKRTLSVHHIDYIKINNFPQNCVSLCTQCHTRTNSDREAWTLFFQKMLSEKYDYQYTEDQKIILDFIGDKNNN